MLMVLLMNKKAGPDDDNIPCETSDFLAGLKVSIKKELTRFTGTIDKFLVIVWLEEVK